MSLAAGNGQTTTLVYDGDGQLVKQSGPEGVTLFVGPHYEVQTVATPAPVPSPTPTLPPGFTPRTRLPLVWNRPLTVAEQPAQAIKAYLAAGQRIARRTGSDGPLTYYYHDHLGSAVASSDTSNNRLRYYPYGAVRSGSLSTTYRYTGQREEAAVGLYYYGARWYDAAIGRFLQPDTLVPDPANPQALNRYIYVRNHPKKHGSHGSHGSASGMM